MRPFAHINLLLVHAIFLLKPTTLPEIPELRNPLWVDNFFVKRMARALALACLEVIRIGNSFFLATKYLNDYGTVSIDARDRCWAPAICARDSRLQIPYFVVQKVCDKPE